MPGKRQKGRSACNGACGGASFAWTMSREQKSRQALLQAQSSPMQKIRDI